MCLPKYCISYQLRLPQSVCLHHTEHVITVIGRSKQDLNEDRKSSFINKNKCEGSASVLWCLFWLVYHFCLEKGMWTWRGPSDKVLVHVYNLYVTYAFSKATEGIKERDAILQAGYCGQRRIRIQAVCASDFMIRVWLSLSRLLPTLYN